MRRRGLRGGPRRAPHQRIHPLSQAGGLPKAVDRQTGLQDHLGVEPLVMRTQWSDLFRLQVGPNGRAPATAATWLGLPRRTSTPARRCNRLP